MASCKLSNVCSSCQRYRTPRPWGEVSFKSASHHDQEDMSVYTCSSYSSFTCQWKIKPPWEAILSVSLPCFANLAGPFPKDTFPSFHSLQEDARHHIGVLSDGVFLHTISGKADCPNGQFTTVCSSLRAELDGRMEES